VRITLIAGPHTLKCGAKQPPSLSIIANAERGITKLYRRRAAGKKLWSNATGSMSVPMSPALGTAGSRTEANDS